MFKPLHVSHLGCGVQLRESRQKSNGQCKIVWKSQERIQQQREGTF